MLSRIRARRLSVIHNRDMEDEEECTLVNEVERYTDEGEEGKRVEHWLGMLTWECDWQRYREIGGSGV